MDVRTYRDYLDENGNVRDDRKEHYKAFCWIAKNVFGSLNFEVSSAKLDQIRQDESDSNFLQRVYTDTDEAFGLLMVYNYEERWRNQVLFPTNSRELLNNSNLYKTRYTSSTNGYSVLPWDEEGVDLFNKWTGYIKTFRTDSVKGTLLEDTLWDTLENQGKRKKKKRKKKVIEKVPHIGGGITRKLAALRENNRLEEIATDSAQV